MKYRIVKHKDGTYRAYTKKLLWWSAEEEYHESWIGEELSIRPFKSSKEVRDHLIYIYCTPDIIIEEGRLI